MAKDTNDTPGKVAEAPADFPLTLDEFCARLSSTDRRVELIAAFHHNERAAGQMKDTSAAFQNRFVAFQSKPT